jgi:CO dehydrogenase maturation factor
MSFRIAIAGKGGVGKSTTAALLVRALHEKTGKIIMAVDADPNSNLGEKLGIEVGRTIGGLREDLLKKGDEIPVSQSKQEYVRYQMRLALVEGEGFDMLAMGRPEGRGCYCYINNVLRTYLDLAMDDYEYVVIDNEAGMEHLSRRTTKSMDVLLLVSDPSKVGIETASRLIVLANEMDLEVKRSVLFVNGIRTSPPPSVLEQIGKLNVDEVEYIPFSDDVLNSSAEGASIWELSGEDHALKAVSAALSRLL